LFVNGNLEENRKIPQRKNFNVLLAIERKFVKSDFKMYFLGSVEIKVIEKVNSL